LGRVTRGFPMASMTERTAHGLYDPAFEHDSCGFGLIANLDDMPSHWVVETAISALARLTHRGAVAADGKTGDGCGLLIKFPFAFLRAVGEDLGFELNDRFATGTVFLHQDEQRADIARDRINAAVAEIGLQVAGWRKVPIDPSVCGEQALKTLPISNRYTLMRRTEWRAAVLIGACFSPAGAPSDTSARVMLTLRACLR